MSRPRRPSLVGRALLAATIILSAALASGCTAPAVPAPSSTAGLSDAPILVEWYPHNGNLKTIMIADDPTATAAAVLVPPTSTTDTVHASWSPDGERFAFEKITSTNAASVWIADADGGQAAQAVTCQGPPCLQTSYPSFTSDGTALLVVQYDSPDQGLTWGASHLVLVNLASGAQTTIASTADGTTAFYLPSLSPDGSHVAVQLESYSDDGESEISGSVIAVVDTDPATSDAPEPVTDPALFAGYPRWHPSDGRILFASWDLNAFHEDEDSQLYTVRSDGSDLVQITHVEDGSQRPGEASWADGGTVILCGLGLVTPDHRVADVAVSRVDPASGEITRLPFSGAMPTQRPTG